MNIKGKSKEQLIEYGHRMQNSRPSHPKIHHILGAIKSIENKKNKIS